MTNSDVPAGRAVALIVLQLGCVLLGLEMFQPKPPQKPVEAPVVVQERQQPAGQYSGGLYR